MEGRTGVWPGFLDSRLIWLVNLDGSDRSNGHSIDLYQTDCFLSFLFFFLFWGVGGRQYITRPGVLLVAAL